MEYQTICKIKESEKATVELAAVELFVGPVIVKRLKGGKPEIYRLLAMQNNPHIPQIYAVEEKEDELLVAEEYVDGESLGEYLQKKLLSDEKKIALALQLCEAVGFLHALSPSIIHRDIKPSNILITGKGELKLIDFDASRQYKETPSSSDTRLLGTVEYAPPEQFGYSQTDVRSDIYSMGVVFHEMRPTENKKLEELWEKIAEKCTSFDPKNRYQSVAELKRELEKLATWKRRRKQKLMAWFGVIAAILVLGVLCTALWVRQRKTEQTDRTVPTNAPTATLSPLPTETPTPEPTATSTPMPTSQPTETPSPTPISTQTTPPLVLVEKDNGVEISVGSDDGEDEILAGLYAQDYYVDTFYKGLNTGVDFMQYSTLYEGKDVEFTDVTVWSLSTEEGFRVPEEFFYNENNILHINREYMSEWEAGVYRLKINYKDKANGRTGTMETHLLLSEGAEVAADAMLFDNNYLDFYYEYYDRVHTIVSNDIIGSFKDTGVWRLLENGRVAEFDTEFLMQYIEPGESGILNIHMELADGRSQNLKICYMPGKPSYAK